MKTKDLLTAEDIHALKLINESSPASNWKTTWMSKVEEIARREHVSMVDVMAEFVPHDVTGMTLEEGLAQRRRA